MMRKKAVHKFFVSLAVFVAFLCVMGLQGFAQAAELPNFGFNVGGEEGTATTVQLLLVVTLITLIPSILMVMTSFTRTIITLHFVRAALGTQQMPPNQVLIGLALFLTIFQMGTTFNVILEDAWRPLQAQEINQEQFLSATMNALRAYMFTQVRADDLEMMARISGGDFSTDVAEEIPTTVLIPAFIIGEITRGFIIGFVLFMPFIVIDMVVASVLMSMGMMMLPPAMISMPFKLMLFVLVNGWSLIIENFFRTF
jgi:flagellar biosynthetic protein FliP